MSNNKKLIKRNVSFTTFHSLIDEIVSGISRQEKYKK